MRNGLEVQAAILSYPYDFYAGAVEGFENVTNPLWLVKGAIGRGVFGDQFNLLEHHEMYKAVSPIDNIPLSSARQLPPQLLIVGSEDPWSRQRRSRPTMVHCKRQVIQHDIGNMSGNPMPFSIQGQT